MGGILGVIVPRLALIGMWLFTGMINGPNGAFNGPILPLLGLIFLPITTMAYAFVHIGNMSLISWLVVGAAVVLDLSVSGVSGWTNRKQIPGYKQKGYDNP